MSSEGDKQKGDGKAQPAAIPRVSKRQKTKNSKYGQEDSPHYVESNEHLDNDDFVNADEGSDDNDDTGVSNDVHEGTGASGVNSTKGAATSDAMAGTSRFSFDIPPDVEPTLVESLDVIMTLAEKRRVWAGEYINLHGFLPLVEGSSRPVVMSVQDGRIVSTIENKVVRNIDEWMTAFVNYMMIYVEGNMAKYKDVLTYFKIIRFAAANFEGYGWRVYDMHFRMSMRNNPHKSWSTVDQNLWALYVTKPSYRPREGLSGAKGQSATASGRSHFRGQKRGFPAGGRGAKGDGKQTQYAQGASGGDNSRGRLCSFFNKGNCSKGKSCQFAHKCTECQGNHPAAQCRRSK